MSVLRLMFLVALITGLGYFLVAKRAFDAWTLAFIGACFYFLPGVLGFASYAEGIGLRASELVPGAYGVMALILATVLLCGILASKSSVVRAGCGQEASSLFDRCFAVVAVIGGYVGCVLTVVAVGPGLLEADKVALLGQLDRWHLLWATGAAIGLASGVAVRSRAVVLAALPLHAINLMIGFRVDFVLACLGCVFLVQQRKGAQRLIAKWKMMGGVVALAVGMTLFKYFLIAIQLMDMELIARQVANPELIRDMALYSEPFVVQGTLNEVIGREFFTGPEHLASALYVMIPFANDLGANVVGFNDLFQPTLFSSVTEFGLGSNIWAEMLASGGWRLLVVFVAAWALICAWLQGMASGRNRSVTATGALLLAYWGFYVHRNDLLYQLTLTKRFALAALVFAALTWAVVRVLPTRAGVPWRARAD